MSEQSRISQFSEELIQTIPYIVRLSRFILSRHADALTQGKITIPQYLVLDMLNAMGTLKMKEIARGLRISLPAATGLIDRLVNMRMVRRVYDPNDRRVIFVTLTSEGKKTIEQVKLARKKMIQGIFGGLTDKERKVYLRIMRKLKKILYEKYKTI